MKKLAARDYEDLLQVRNRVFLKVNCQRFIPVLSSGV